MIGLHWKAISLIIARCNKQFINDAAIVSGAIQWTRRG